MNETRVLLSLAVGTDEVAVAVVYVVACCVVLCL